MIPFRCLTFRRAHDGRQILRDLFANCVAAAEILDIDEDFRPRWP